MDGQHPTRREVLKKAVYTAPAILTLAAGLSFAGTGSPGPKNSNGCGRINKSWKKPNKRQLGIV
jgi:hypothetical protein